MFASILLLEINEISKIVKENFQKSDSWNENINGFFSLLVCIHFCE